MLTPAELERFKHLIPRDVPRGISTINNTSRRDNTSSRVRGSARYRAAPSTHQAPILRLNSNILASLRGSSSDSEIPGNTGNDSNTPGEQIFRNIFPGISSAIPTRTTTDTSAVSVTSEASNSGMQSTTFGSAGRTFDSATALDRLYTRLGFMTPNSTPSAVSAETPTGSSTQDNSGISLYYFIDQCKIVPLICQFCIVHFVSAMIDSRVGVAENSTPSERPSPMDIAEEATPQHFLERRETRNPLQRIRFVDSLGANRTDSRSRYDPSRMSLAIRACLLSRAGMRNLPDTNGSTTNETNRSVPDLESQTQHNRFKEAILNRLISFRVRMQQTRIDNIEREMSLRSRLSTLMPNLGRTDNRDRPRRHSTLSQNRHAPYVPNVRQFITNRSTTGIVASRLSESTTHVTAAGANNDTSNSPIDNIGNESSTRSRSETANLQSTSFVDPPLMGNRLRSTQSVAASEPISALARDSRIVRHGGSPPWDPSRNLPSPRTSRE